MPFAAPGSIKAKDADIQDQHIATAQGNGLIATPYVPLHADIGVGDPSDPISTDPADPVTVISLVKGIFNQVIFFTAQINSIFTSVGSLVELPATSELASASIAGLLKLLIKRSPKVPSYITAYISLATDNSDIAVANPCLLGAIDIINLTSSMRYLWLYDSDNIAALTTPGQMPFRVFPVYPSNGLLTIDHSHWGTQPTGQGRELAYGLVWAISTTPATLTIGGNADCIVQMDFADLTV
jgi:hypothetical protein